jgi:hypothetical protein
VQALRKGTINYTIRFERVHAFFDRFVRSHSRLGALHCKEPDAYLIVVRLLRMFFPPEAAPMVLARWRDQIGAKDTKAGLAAAQLCNFLPPSALPGIIDDFMKLIDAYPGGGVIASVFSFLKDAAGHTRIDWVRYLDRLFQGILRCLEPQINIAGRRVRMLPKKAQALARDFAYLTTQKELPAAVSAIGLICELIDDTEQGSSCSDASTA